MDRFADAQFDSYGAHCRDTCRDLRDVQRDRHARGDPGCVVTIRCFRSATPIVMDNQLGAAPEIQPVSLTETPSPPRSTEST